MVFWITFFVLVGKATVFVLFGSGEVQPWNDPNHKRERHSENNNNGRPNEKITVA